MKSFRNTLLAKVILLALAVPLLQSCAMNSVLYRARREHYHYWTITRVTDARLVDGDLWLMLQLNRESADISKLAALRIAANDAVWLTDHDGKKTCPAAVPWKHAPWVSPVAADLQDPSVFPTSGQELTIRTVQTGHPSGVAGLHTQEHPWSVLFVTFDYPGTSSAPVGGWQPVLALANDATVGSEGDKCVLDTFYVNTTRHKAWYLLTPFALVSDIATMPIQLLALLVWVIGGE